MNDDLVATLTLLRECRISLVQDFIQKDSDRYYFSFRYGKSPTSFAIAQSLTDHQWLDEHYNTASLKFEKKEISKNCMLMFLKVLQRFSILKCEVKLFDVQRELNSTKIAALESLLSHSETMNDRMRLIEFNYYRDKRLFEIEIEQYMNTL